MLLEWNIVISHRHLVIIGAQTNSVARRDGEPSRVMWALKESDRGRKDLRDVTGEFPTLKFDSE